MRFFNLGNKKEQQSFRSNKNYSAISNNLLPIAEKEAEEVLESFKAPLYGLSAKEAHERLKRYGPNEVVHEKKDNFLILLLKTFKNPLIILLIILGAVSFITEDTPGTIVISIMVIVSVTIRVFQEFKANNAAAKLKAMVKTTATVIRHDQKKEVPINLLVPGDIVHLSAGDMVPADARIISSKDLFMNQATLTGESLPVDKHASKVANDIKNPLELSNICFMGTNVESGTATAVVVATGKNTYFGALAESITTQQVVTNFDKGIKSFTWLMISFMLVIVPLVFLLNGLLKHNWLEAFLFGVAVAVGLTPEMLPMIVTVNLSKGAIIMSRKKVIVKRLNSIQNFGAMNILCTDKTGTITLGKVILEKHIDVFGNEQNQQVLEYAYLNSYYQTGLKNILDEAVLKHVDLHTNLKVDKNFKKIDEVTFDFIRKRMSVIIEKESSKRILICKGAVEEVMGVSTKAQVGDKVFNLEKSHREKVGNIVNRLNNDGFRVIAVAYKETSSKQSVYATKDESGLVLLGFIAFLDPPKDTAFDAISKLHKNGIEIKILTGDSELVTQKICKEVGISVKGILIGNDIEAMPDEKLANVAESTTIFARLLPYHKERIIKVLQQKGHIVGFLGDGINDSGALKVSDIGISVDTAVDIAKEASDIILLKKSLLVLNEGVIEGRKVFGNIIKYIRMAGSSNFGNMFSVIGASIFLPFLPMLPVQILANNLLYDMSQTAIPTDDVDEEYLTKPRKWKIDDIKQYILYIGPISSIFDYTTFFIMLYAFKSWTNPSLFQTGWFVESLLTQTLIIHVIRTNKIPFIQSRASWPLLFSSVIISIIGLWLPFSPFAATLGFTTLPPLYFMLLIMMLVSYIVLTQIIKTWYVKKQLTE